MIRLLMALVVMTIPVYDALGRMLTDPDPTPGSVFDGPDATELCDTTPIRCVDTPQGQVCETREGRSCIIVDDGAPL